MTKNEGLENAQPNRSGLGGWLGILLIGMIISSALLLVALVANLDGGEYAKLFGNTWLVPTFLIWDTVYMIIFGFSSFLLIKRKVLAIRVIKHSLWTFALINVFLVNAQMIDARNAVHAGLITQSMADNWTSSVGSDAGRAIIAALIWIPYLKRSKRVQSTLLN